MKELLYSIRHTQGWDSEPINIGEHANQDKRLSKEELDASFQALLDKCKNESEFVPVPDRLKIADKLISRTVALAKELEFNVDITRNEDSIDFCFFDSVGLFQGELKDFFGEMFIICDSVSMYKPKEGTVPLHGDSWIVDFSFFTHRHFVAGREIPQFTP